MPSLAAGSKASLTMQSLLRPLLAVQANALRSDVVPASRSTTAAAPRPARCSSCYHWNERI